MYAPLVPVARPSLAGWTGPNSNVALGTDLVTCLSCHRPHGSPYPDMLRWDYENMQLGGGGDDGTGCFVRHTTKDA
jgi:predicted CXXCH cytochrome family protein